MSDPSQINSIKMAMLKSMTPEQRASLMGNGGQGPQPGDMGREGDLEPPPIDEAALMQEMQGVGPQMPPQAAPQAPAQPQPLTPTPPPAQAGGALSMIPGVQGSMPSAEDEAGFNSALAGMDGNIQYSRQNNEAIAQRMGVSPEELAAATARGRQMNGPAQQLGNPAPPSPQGGPSMMNNPGSKLARVLMMMGLK